MKKAMIGFSLAAAFILIVLFAVPPTGLSIPGFRIFCLIIVAVTFCCLEVIPVTVTAVLLVVAVPALGIETAREAIAASGSSAFFFLIAAFGICAGLIQIKIPQRLMAFIFKKTGNDSNRILSGYILVSALISVLVTDAAATVIGAGLAAPLLFSAAMAAGVSVGVTCMLIAIWCGVTFLLPVEATYMLTYSYGHYQFIDVMKAGILPTIVLLALSLSIVPLIGGWVGL